jgi:uncharacterized protein YbjQ (UPF0145 family)
MSQTHPLTTTAFELPGYRTVKSFGVVRGIIVRSRSIVGNIGASIGKKKMKDDEHTEESDEKEDTSDDASDEEVKKTAAVVRAQLQKNA